MVRVTVSVQDILEGQRGAIFAAICDKVAEPIARFIKLEVIRRINIDEIAKSVQDSLTKAAIEAAAKHIAHGGAR